MKKWELQIEIKSDFCTAVGESVPGLLNCKTALEYGIPYIRAKRIKGCLLESGRELADNGMFDKDILNRIFGQPGQAQGQGIVVGNGQLLKVPGYLLGQENDKTFIIKDYEQFLREIQSKKESEILWLESLFTRKRTRTALTADGSAKKHSLRTIQVVPAGMVFSCQLWGELSSEEEEALGLCVKGLRHMGMEISRGLGEVRCGLRPITQAENSGRGESSRLLQQFSPEKEIRLSYEIELKSPIVLDGNRGQGLDYIPGGTLQGALAGLYIREFKLGDLAHEDNNFNRIFLRDGIQFGNAFLKQGEMEYVPCPKAFAIPKEEPEKWLHVMRNEGDRRRKNISGQVALQGSNLHTKMPEKEIHFHHARPKNTSIPTGQFFHYIALSKGQKFAGTWQGKSGDISRVIGCLEKQQYQLMLGRSRTAEYGCCNFRLTNVALAEPTESEFPRGKEWLVWLISPLLVTNRQNGTGEMRHEILAELMTVELGCEVELIDAICDGTVVDGYNSKWRLPAVPVPALAAGSTFHIRTKREVAVEEITGRRWGLQTGKGCGEVRAVSWECCKGGNIILAVNEKEPAQLSEAAELSEAIKECYQQAKAAEAEGSRALKDITELVNTKNLPSSSDIVLLADLVKGRNGLPEEYETIVNKVKKIRREEKREQLLKFLEPCKGGTADFMEKYLQVAKWEARGKDK